MYYFKNIFCLLVLCITVSAQDWPVGRVSEKATISIWKNTTLTESRRSCKKIFTTTFRKVIDLAKEIDRLMISILSCSQSHDRTVTVKIVLPQLNYLVCGYGYSKSGSRYCSTAKSSHVYETWSKFIFPTEKPKRANNFVTVILMNVI